MYHFAVLLTLHFYQTIKNFRDRLHAKINPAPTPLAKTVDLSYTKERPFLHQIKLYGLLLLVT